MTHTALSERIAARSLAEKVDVQKLDTRIFALELASKMAMDGEDRETTVKRAQAFETFLRGLQIYDGTEKK